MAKTAQASAANASKLAQVKSINLKDKRTLRVIFELLLVAAIVVLGLWVKNLQQDKKDLTASKNSLNTQLTALRANPQLAVDQQTKDLLSKVSKLYHLPTNETPTIATVSDPAKAKKQSAFFTNAQKDDKVLLYVKAGEAILYRPSSNQIILVAPLSFSTTKK